MNFTRHSTFDIKKIFFTFLILFLFPFGYTLWSSFFEKVAFHFINEMNFVIKIVLLLGVSILILLLISRIATITKYSPPKEYEVFISWEYPKKYWLNFKKAEYRKREFFIFKSLAVYVIIIFVCTGQPFFIYFEGFEVFLHITKTFLWVILMVFILVFSYYQKTFYAEKKRQLLVSKPNFCLLKEGMILNHVYIPIRTHIYQINIEISVVEKYNTYCFLVEKEEIIPNQEEDAKHYNTYLIPLPVKETFDIRQTINLFKKYWNCSVTLKKDTEEFLKIEANGGTV